MFKKIYFLIFILPFLFVHQSIAQSMCTLNGRQIPCDQMVNQAGKIIGATWVFSSIFGILSTVGVIFWILMLVHAATHPIENKLIWILIIIFTNIVGAVIYYFVVKRNYIGSVSTNSIQPSLPSSSPLSQYPPTPQPPSQPH